jgi:hypothetical protein
MNKNILLKSILSIFLLIGIMLLESACNDDRPGPCNNGGLFQINTFDSISLQTYGLANRNPDTVNLNDFLLLLHFSTERMAFVSGKKFSCYATPPCSPPTLTYHFDSIQIRPTNQVFQLSDSNWYLLQMGLTLRDFDKDFNKMNQDYISEYFILNLINFQIDNPITTSFKVLVYKEDAIIFEEETKSITLIP